MPVARDEVIVDHSDRLHERIDDRRTAEAETALRKRLRNGA